MKGGDLNMKIVLILLFIFLSPTAQAENSKEFEEEYNLLEFSDKSKKAVIGRYNDVITFSSVLEREDYAIVDIRLRNEKQLIARVNYQDETFDIKFISIKTGELERLSKGDIQYLHLLFSSLGKDFPTIGGYRHTAVDALLSILNLLEGYPPGEFLNILNEVKKKNDEGWESLCDQIGNTRRGIYIIGDTYHIEEEEIGPCASGDCFGRCGPDCGLPPNPLVQRFTQECFNHDLCARATGEWFGPCTEEWSIAAPGFLFATDCNEIRHDWTVRMRGTSCFEGDCEDIDFVRLYHFSQSDTDFSFVGKSDPHPIDGRKSAYQGQALEENRVSGRWRVAGYMGPECGNQPAGYARGTFTGENYCGEMTMSDVGLWGWYSLDTCTLLGDGSFDGTSEATRDAWNVQLEDLEKHEIKRTRKSLVPAIP